ncbi:hypothetical protein [Mumia sp. Pv 4-285]|uniref:hypothetical protein n=1 Tax=Mumia qirimensis TaxID=3234852 RepID=UPI00351D6582
MALRPLTDLGPADWLITADAAGFDVICLGAPGFDTYVRLLHPLDEDLSGENATLNAEGDLDEVQMVALCEVLARHTSTPDDAYHGLWDGFGQLRGGVFVSLTTGESGQLPQAFPAEVMAYPRVALRKGRSYLLFRGPLADAGHWGGNSVHGWINSPNLLWPADRAWCVATEIDYPWTGIGGPQSLIDELHSDDRFDVVHADPYGTQPYR